METTKFSPQIFLPSFYQFNCSLIFFFIKKLVFDFFIKMKIIFFNKKNTESILVRTYLQICSEIKIVFTPPES